MWLLTSQIIIYYYLFSIGRIFVVKKNLVVVEKKKVQERGNISKEKCIISLNFKHILRNL